MYQVIYVYDHSSNIKRSDYFRAVDGEMVSLQIMDWKNYLKQRHGVTVTILDVVRVGRK